MDVFTEVARALRNSVLPPSIASEIGDDNFHEVKAFFQTEEHEHKIDLTIDLPHISMTCLEYAVHLGKWEMACFLVTTLGANPEKNAFEGYVPDMASLSGYGPPEIIEEFEETTIPGYRGLRAVATVFLERESLEKMMAFLTLMEWALSTDNDAGRSAQEKIVLAIGNLRLLDSPPHLISTKAIESLKEKLALIQCLLSQAQKLPVYLVNDFLSVAAKDHVREALCDSASVYAHSLEGDGELGSIGDSRSAL